MCRIHVSSTRERLGDLAKGLWRSAEFSASHTGWRSDLALGTASKWHFFAFLEAETPYPTPEYHDTMTWLEPAGGRTWGPLGADGKTTTSPTYTGVSRKGV